MNSVRRKILGTPMPVLVTNRKECRPTVTTCHMRKWRYRSV